MKNIGFVIVLCLLSTTALGQQALWSTMKKDTAGVKYVPLNNVTKEVLTFYDQYKYYFDLSGYSKKRFIDEINYGFDDWNWLYDIKDLTVSALRSNTGRGSFVMIICVSNNNVNLIVFSNDIMFHRNYQSTGSYSKERFVSWFNTLLN